MGWGGGFFTAGLVFLLIATACGGDSAEGGAQISWRRGTPPLELAQELQSLPSSPETRVAEGSTDRAPRVATPPPMPTTAVLSAALTEDQRAFLRPNELGVVPVLMYHDIVDSPTTTVPYTRTLQDFQDELQRLSDGGYFVVPLRDAILNQIAAPAGKHPVVLTFDDGIANQFRYLVSADGSLTIDPTSAVGVLEAFFNEHPDFGRGGFFAVPPDWCFDWTAEAAEPDQTAYCGQKLDWLIDHGYEVGNHTLGHSDLFDLDDEEFVEKVGRGWIGLQEEAPNAQGDILAMPFGNYSNLEKHRAQRTMMREGFEFQGRFLKLLGALQVGAEPAMSPLSTE